MILNAGQRVRTDYLTTTTAAQQKASAARMPLIEAALFSMRSGPAGTCAPEVAFAGETSRRG